MCKFSQGNINNSFHKFSFEALLCWLLTFILILTFKNRNIIINQIELSFLKKKKKSYKNLHTKINEIVIYLIVSLQYITLFI